MRSMKIAISAVLVALAIAVLSTCTFIDSIFGLEVSFLVTDSPISAASVREVWATISSVSVQVSETGETDGWVEATKDPPLELDLLALRNGLTESLGELTLPAGSKITQMVLGVDSIRVVETGGTAVKAKLPSSRLKINGPFDVPATGSISFTIDFDLGKSVVLKDGEYSVKPVLRSVVTWEAGRISGSIGSSGAVLIYAYADGTWSAAEAEENSDGASFTGAYASTMPSTSGSFVLAFLAPGVYDAVAVDSSGRVISIIEDLTVQSGQTTSAAGF